jgi:hypothetical protein
LGEFMTHKVPSHPYTIGANYFIRTVTHHHVGRLVAVYQQELVLEGASWVPDDGKFSEALATGVFNEIEPFPAVPVIIGRASIIDACAPPGLELPTQVK